VLTRLTSLLPLACALLSGGVAASSVTPLHTGTAHDALYGMCLEGEHGLAVGAFGMVLESRDGGTNWKQLPGFSDEALLDISCGAGPRLVVGQEGHIYRLEGDTFQSVDSGTDARLLGVDSNASGLAVAVGGFGTVLRSRDGGQSWEPVVFDWEAVLNDFVEPHLYDVDVSDQGVITIVGEFELVLRSTDGGDTWEATHKGEASLFAVDLRADGNGYAVGQDGRVIRTDDAGGSWSEVETPVESILLDVWSDDSGDVLISGIRTFLRSKDAGATWEVVQGGDLNVGWYQRLVVPRSGDQAASVALLAGHQGDIVQLNLK
jgi:photosystem II stability/assembly factor-like uncharacterized protein